MAEWSKAPDSKSGLGQPNGGSNPSLSASSGGRAAIVCANFWQRSFRAKNWVLPQFFVNAAAHGQRLSGAAQRPGAHSGRLAHVAGGTAPSPDALKDDPGWGSTSSGKAGTFVRIITADAMTLFGTTICSLDSATSVV